MQKLSARTITPKITFSLDNFVTFQELEKRHPMFTVKELRRWQYKKIPGFLRCLRKVKGRIFVNMDEFINWINEMVI